LTASRGSLHSLLELRERMNQLLDDLVRPAEGALGWTPLADVYETPSAFYVCMDLAGVELETLQVREAQGSVVVTGVRVCPCDGAEDVHRLERAYGPFSRTLPLSGPVALGGVRQEYVDGVLRLTLPRVVSTDSVGP
jgi:HSP20 family protein